MKGRLGVAVCRTPAILTHQKESLAVCERCSCPRVVTRGCTKVLIKVLEDLDKTIVRHTVEPLRL